MSINGGLQAVPICYVFKSRLQEYAQKVGLPTPVYETIKEGPSHEPSFRSTVIVNNVSYDSLSGFFNRKAAEQSAAEVALMELANSGEKNECISQAVSETGLCKNLLQEYAQKMNYANPCYQCQKEEMPGRGSLISCNVEIGGIKYIGAAAHTKKEAEIKAARTALLALQFSSPSPTEKPSANSMYTVIPCKRKGTDLGMNSQETAKTLKPKKRSFKKKRRKKRDARDRNNHIQGKNMGGIEVNINSKAGQELDRTEAFGVQTTDSGFLATKNFQDQICFNGSEEGSLPLYKNGNSKDGQVTFPNFCQTDPGSSSTIREGDLTSKVKETNKIFGVEQVASMVNNSTDGNSKDGQATVLNFPQSDQVIPNLGSSFTVNEENTISGVEHVASMVNNSTDGNSKDGQATLLNFPQSDLGIPNLGSSLTVNEPNTISGVEQVASVVNNSTDGNSKDGQATVLNFPQSDLGIPNLESSFTVIEANTISGVEQVASMVNDSTVCQAEVPSGMEGLNQTVRDTGVTEGTIMEA